MSKAVVKMGIIGFLSLACTLFVAMPAQAEIVVGGQEWYKAADVTFTHVGSGDESINPTRYNEDGETTKAFKPFEYSVKRDENNGGFMHSFGTSLNSEYSSYEVAMSLSGSSNFIDDILRSFRGVNDLNWSYGEVDGMLFGLISNPSSIDFSFFLDGLDEGETYSFVLYTNEPSAVDADVDGNSSPEPATLLIFGLGTVGAGIVGYRKRRGRK